MTGRFSRPAVEISIAVIMKQPSPVIVATFLSGLTRWAPNAAGIDQPIAWLSVGLKYVRGLFTVKASAARCSLTVTSTKTRPSSGRHLRSARMNAIGSAP